MRKKSIVIGASVLLSTAIITATTRMVGLPFDFVSSWLAPTPTVTLGNEVRVIVPKDFPPIRELYITRPITGTHIEIK